MATDILSPVGRLVQGHPLRPITKNKQGQQLTFRDGSPRQNFFFAIAVAKTNVKWAEMFAAVEQEALSSWPNKKGKLKFPDANFSWKIKDGDEYEDFPEVAGHWVISFSNSYVSEVVDLVSRAQLINEDQIKPGDYVQVYFTCKGNGNRDKPGVYLNQVSVGKVMAGEPIIRKKSYIDVFDAV